MRRPARRLPVVHLVAPPLRRLGILVLLVLAAVVGAGCGTDCRRACEHVLEECGVERPGYSIDDCEAECGRFLTHYEDRWEEGVAEDAVTCVRTTACADLRSGTPCYDAAVYIW